MKKNICFRLCYRLTRKLLHPFRSTSSGSEITPPYPHITSYTRDQLQSFGLKVGENSIVSDSFWENAEPYLIEIGSNCQITSGSKAFTHGGAQVARDRFPSFDYFGQVKIGDYVYIGNNSLIMPGVSIGSHVLVAAGSVVTKSIPDGFVVAGNPAKIITSTDKWIDNHKQFDLETKGLDYLKKKALIEAASENKFVKKDYLNL